MFDMMMMMMMMMVMMMTRPTTPESVGIGGENVLYESVDIRVW